MKKTLFLIIFLSVFTGVYFLYLRNKDRQNAIEYIVQMGNWEKPLECDYLAYLLDLSKDRPSFMLDFNEKKALEKIKKSPVIENVFIKKIRPKSILIDYELKEPIAHLLDFDNVALDVKGSLFPLKPFYEKKLPSIYVEENFDLKNIWNMKSSKIDLALDVLNYLKDKEVDIQCIDVSKILAKSYGQREIVIKVEHKIKCLKGTFIFPRFIRLPVKNYKHQLNNYFILHDKMMKDYVKQLPYKTNLKFATKVIDMRMLKMAFIDES